MKYICSNCGYLQDEIGVSGGCAHSFWGWCIIVTLLISLFYWLGFIVLAFEILFFILTGGKSNCCKKCKAKDCVIPVNTPRGEKIFNEYYEYVEEETEQEEQEQLTGEIETQSDDENDYTFTKIKVQKTKSWKEIAQENQATIIMLVLGLFALFAVLIILYPLSNTNDSKNIEQNKPVQKVEVTSEAKITQPTQPVPQKKNNKQIEKISINEQSKDGKGVFLPLSENAGILVNNTVFSQIFIHEKYNIQVYYVDLKKYPQFLDSLAEDSVDLVEMLSSTNPENIKSPVDIYIFTEMKDLYYLRNLPQYHKNIELELMKLQPILHINYNPNVIMSLCIKTPDGYQNMGKTSFNNWQWEYGSNGVACSYEELKRVYDFYDKN